MKQRTPESTYHLRNDRLREPIINGSIAAKISSSRVSFTQRSLSEPLILSSGTISEVTEAEVTVYVESNRIEGVGKGSVYLSDLWAWPGSTPSREIKLDAMKTMCRRISAELPVICPDAQHPLEHGLRLHRLAIEDNTYRSVDSELARALCASPFDAAIHDATGIALGMSAMRFYDAPATIPSADSLFSDGAVTAIRQVLRQPVPLLPGWYIAGPATPADAVRKAVEDYGIRQIKLKTSGIDPQRDAEQTATVYSVAANTSETAASTPSRDLPRSTYSGDDQISLVVDSNEANHDAASVLEYLDRLESIDAKAYAALAYLEQPTPRDIEEHPFDWSAVSKRKRVLIDEGLTDIRLFPVARKQGWSGFALKTCKGHSFTLVAAAWAHRNGMCISLQDLTNPGYSAIHAALLASHLPTINGVELNSWQFTPEANTRWIPRLGEMLTPHNGVHVIAATDATGLGSNL
jgi:L-alanine-DL-glutamate epimerase-like enolase superfamily enzyme